MRIRVLSDLHREFGHVKSPEVSADVVVLAGDIDRGTKGVAWARQEFPGVPVLYVAGNHEHFDERIGSSPCSTGWSAPPDVAAGREGGRLNIDRLRVARGQHGPISNLPRALPMSLGNRRFDRPC